MKTGSIVAVQLISFVLGISAASAIGETDAVSIQAIATDQASSGALRSAAQYAARQGNYEQAISYLKKSLKKNDDDMDTHQQYAECLEAKFREQSDGDPLLFEACVKEWLIVLRQERGEERGQTFHGIGIPLAGQYFQDEERNIEAKAHLIDLTGSSPKGWETDARYISRVCKKAKLAVRAELRNSRSTGSK